MGNNTTLTGIKARDKQVSAKDIAQEKFGSLLTGNVSAQYIGFTKKPVVAAVSGLPFESPLVTVILQLKEIGDVLSRLFAEGKSVLFTAEGELYSEGNDSPEALTDAQKAAVKAVIDDSRTWGGRLADNGELVFDPSTPVPGPHYYTNMLIGNRIGFDRPLQSTPKSAVDALGGGSFRAHADTQVLATKWDYLPEENGFPANRQFYITENGKKIFWSGSAKADGIIKVTTTHAQNRTRIVYELADGLKITRTIFILPSEDDMPLAAEAQMIDIENTGVEDRDLRIVYTGMFGTSEVHALREDVIFSTVVAQSEVFFDEDEKIKAVCFDPNPKWTKGNIRWNTLLVHEGDTVKFPEQYCARYADFVGNGTLSDPEFISYLADRHSRKGPGFFALATPFTVKAGSSVRADNFTCLTTDVLNDDYVEDETVKTEILALIDRYSDRDALPAAYDKVISFTRDYAKYMKISHEDKNFESYVNNNLPFQVFYQTFVSRSLDWTQKGYREIGFREIQDIFASMYYFAGMGQQEFVKKLLREWTGNVFPEGFTNHNFYWYGKEPGQWSDDGLWLLQALDRYVSLTGDYDFLKEEVVMAREYDTPEEALKAVKTGAGDKRTILDTIKAIITYSAKISVGSHGIPLIDKADWNDCLRVDPDFLPGKKKIEEYKAQLASKGKAFGEVPYESEYSESVMNGFLLKVAIDAAKGMFEKTGDEEYAKELEALSSKVKEDLRANAWKNDFFARVLFNRKDKPELKYLGAAGDDLQVEDAPGSYFLNAFSWSILSDCADEEQISTMLDTMDRYIKSPYGFRLCSTVDYSKIAPKIDVALYYPGDRENGGVFKHANMMAAAAMLKAAKKVSDEGLAARLAKTAYWVIDCILPYKTLKHPFDSCGNPRWCTQYNNSDSGENIGPTLSGTSTWLLLCLFSCFGVEFTSDALIVEPLLREDDTGLDVTVNSGLAVYEISISKPAGFKRTREGVKVFCDGSELPDCRVPIFTDHASHKVEVKFP
ncbi:MAG: glycosyl transferase [Clostridiales bacterium]|nr:glycosyl transferase [Clostridiales bacterium]